MSEFSFTGDLSPVSATVLSLLGKFLDGSELVPFALALIAIVFLLSSVRRRLRRQQDESPRASSLRTPPPTTSKDRLRRDLESLLGELQDLSRRISAEIDTRFAKLEAAMRDADRRIAVLHRLAREEARPPVDAAGAADDHDARHAVVYELADAGMSPVEIAREIGRSPGEIEVILNLRRKTGSTDEEASG